MGTVIDDELIFKAKQKALSGNMPLSRVLEDALKMYLVAANKKTARGKQNVVQETKGAMKVSNKELKAVMEEDGLYES
jgi:hypothetical protein